VAGFVASAGAICPWRVVTVEVDGAKATDTNAALKIIVTIKTGGSWSTEVNGHQDGW
jgi:hypothetical protein